VTRLLYCPKVWRVDLRTSGKVRASSLRGAKLDGSFSCLSQAVAAENPEKAKTDKRPIL